MTDCPCMCLELFRILSERASLVVCMASRFKDSSDCTRTFELNCLLSVVSLTGGGGAFFQRLIATPGISSIFLEGTIPYSRGALFSNLRRTRRWPVRISCEFFHQTSG